MAEVTRVWRCGHCGTLRCRPWDDFCNICGVDVDDGAPVYVGVFLPTPGVTVEWADESSTRLYRHA